MLTMPSARFGIEWCSAATALCCCSPVRHDGAVGDCSAALQAVHRTSSADRARRDAAAEERSTYLHAVGMMPRAFHLLRAIFATGPRVQPVDEVRACHQTVETPRGDCSAVPVCGIHRSMTGTTGILTDA